MGNRCAASPSPRVESDWAAEAAWTSHHPHTLPHSACYVSGSQPFWGWGPPPPTFHFILSLPRLLVRVLQHIYRKRCCKIQGDRFLTPHLTLMRGSTFVKLPIRGVVITKAFYLKMDSRRKNSNESTLLLQVCTCHCIHVNWNLWLHEFVKKICVTSHSISTRK